MPPTDRTKLNAALGREKQLGRSVPSKPDKKTREEDRDLENQKKKIALHSLDQDIEERKKYAKLFFRLSCLWMGTITVLVLLYGWRVYGFWLPDKIVLALIGSTTLNVLGILYVVAHYLFPKR